MKKAIVAGVIVAAVALPFILVYRVHVAEAAWAKSFGPIENVPAKYTPKQLVEDIEMQKKITPEMEKRFLDARERHAQLSKDDDVRPSKRVALRCEREVKAEIPSDRLWIPKEGETS